MATKKLEVKELKPINRKLVTIRIVGVSPLIQHAWSEKAKELMRQKQQEGRKTKDREPRNPAAECLAAGYFCDEERKIPGVLAVAIKAAVVEAAHQDLGIAKVLVRKALFVFPMGREVVLPLETLSGKGKIKSEMVEDMVRVGQGSADLRYRPYFYDWAVTTKWEIDVDMLRVQDLVLLLERAGFGVGIHEWRPEKTGEFGRFRIDGKFKIKEEKALLM